MSALDDELELARLVPAGELDELVTSITRALGGELTILDPRGARLAGPAMDPTGGAAPRPTGGAVGDPTPRRLASRVDPTGIPRPVGRAAGVPTP